MPSCINVDRSHSKVGIVFQSLTGFSKAYRHIHKSESVQRRIMRGVVSFMIVAAGLVAKLDLFLLLKHGADQQIQVNIAVDLGF